MEHQQHFSIEALVFDTGLGHVPDHIRSSAVNLGSRLETVERETTALVANRIRQSCDPPFRKAIMNFLRGMKKECKAQIRSSRRARSIAEHESMAARTRGAMFGGESSTLPPWSESPLVAVYGTDMRTLMKEMSPGIIEGVWEERHHTLCERHFQLNRLTDRLGELVCRVAQLEIMARFLSPHIPPVSLPVSVRFDIDLPTLSGQFAAWARRSIASSQELAMQSTRVAEQSRRFVTRSRWASTQCHRWNLQSEQFVARSRRSPIHSQRFANQNQRFLTRSRKSFAKSRRLFAHSQRLFEKGRLFVTQSGLFNAQCRMILDCEELSHDVGEERRQAVQLTLDYLAEL